ncbi:MAG TPA: hypothetical protein VGE50_03245 [Gammaproteobacteria bacterium]
MIFKKTIKALLRWVLFRNEEKIVVASNGRAGSTMLFEAITRSYIQHRFHLNSTSYIGDKLAKLASNYCDRLADIRKTNAAVIKTHALWDGCAEPGVKYLFVHGDPLDSALSVAGMVDKLGEDWFKEHLYHLESKGGELVDLFQSDVLNYENEIVSWSGAKDDAVLCVAYEQLWEMVSKISEHVGFDVRLPEFIPRPVKASKVAVNQPLFDELRRIRKAVFNMEL